jgi:uncharacterized protein (DUF433 family)
MAQPISLLEKRLYGISQVDRILALKSGTARRWIAGYRRAGRSYPPVIREEATADEVVTWGEFVETRLLAEYRDAGVPVVRMRPAIIRLREALDARYPLAHARPFLEVSGRELVYRVQDEVHLEKSLQLVVVRNGQLVLSEPAAEFVSSVRFGKDGGVAEAIRPLPNVDYVLIDPLRQFGEPSVRSVPTEVIGELVRAGDSITMIAELYELTIDQVEAAVRYELIRGAAGTSSAA